MNKNALRAVLLIFLVFVLAAFVLIYQFVIKKPEAELVAGFPQFPVYQDARLMESAKDPREDIVWDATWVSESDVSSVAKWYTEKLRSEGWVLDVPPSDPEDKEVQNMVFNKDDYYVLHLSVIKNDSGKTEIISEYLKWMSSEKEGKFVGGELVEDEEEPVEK